MNNIGFGIFCFGEKYYFNGTVEKINRKFIIVRENGKAFGNWRVPANMLTVV